MTPCICAEDDRHGFAGGTCYNCGGRIPAQPGFIFYGTHEQQVAMLRALPEIVSNVTEEIANERRDG